MQSALSKMRASAFFVDERAGNRHSRKNSSMLAMAGKVMMQPIELFVEGKPQPAGSKRGFVVKGRAIVTEANPRAKDWKTDVKHAARSISERMEGNVLRCPLCVSVTFTLPRPKSHYRTGKNSHLLREDAPYWHTVKPDATKLLRGTEDALTGLLWADDSQICEQHVQKVYGDRIGAHIFISERDNRPKLP